MQAKGCTVSSGSGSGSSSGSNTQQQAPTGPAAAPGSVPEWDTELALLPMNAPFRRNIPAHLISQ